MSRSQPPPLYRRILLKISGEALKGKGDYGIDRTAVQSITGQIADAHKEGVEIALVVGGGNIFRGTSPIARDIQRSVADSMGMLATVINALMLQSALEKRGITTRVVSAIPMQMICEPYVRRRAIRHLERGRVVIFAAGTGNPFFSTDTAAALRASEMECPVLLKATKVDGVYDRDPSGNSDARRYDQLDYAQVLDQDLRIMDSTAIALARENRIIIIVFSLLTPNSLSNVLKRKGTYTVIQDMKNATQEKTPAQETLEQEMPAQEKTQP